MSKKKSQLVNATLWCLTAAREGKPMAWAATKMSLNKSNVKGYFRELQEHGLLTEGVRSTFKTWQLTKAGEWVLQQVLNGVSERNLSEGWKPVFRWHHLLFRFPRSDAELNTGTQLVAKGFVHKRRGVVTGWEWADKEGALFVTGASVQVFVRPVYSYSPFEAVRQGLHAALVAVQRARQVLPWLKVDGRLELCRQQLALMGVFEEWVPKGYKYVSDRLVIDFSLGTAEVETVHRQFSPDDMFKITGFLESLIRGEL